MGVKNQKIKENAMPLHDLTDKKDSYGNWRCLVQNRMSMINKKLIQSTIRCCPEEKGKKLRAESCMLLKTHIEKMSDYRLSKMLLKTRYLQLALHDIHENKGT